jgi:OOP family OmpA-OmpF porin
MRFYEVTSLTRYVPLLLLAGCAGNLQELREISPKASNFSSSLAAEYLAYSESEIEQGHKLSADYFAAKGVRAAKGETVEPEEVSVSADIPENDLKKLSASRAALIDLLNSDVKKVAPQKAARAQLLFDCWNRQENKKPPLEKVSCAHDFAIAYDELRSVADDLSYGADSKNMVEFPADSSKLDADGLNIIADISSHLAGRGDYALELVPHFDISNAKDRRSRLVKKRLAAVRDALVKAGIPGEKIFYVKPDLASVSKGTVHLSSDKDAKYSNEIDINITSPNHLSIAAP